MELKSWKLYLWSYRDEALSTRPSPIRSSTPGRSTSPRFAKLTAVFNVRGGVYTSVEQYWQDDDFKE